ncbi:MAG: saccharopine dehydrogenase NADP-binding domain-containing protein [Pedobacter sp.]|nr:saccharopine dehydrogenase NADP-binding domain-containing protein [Chitinophagaceae bacterium]
MKTILLFGAGKSATVLIDYLKKMATDCFCNVMIADADLQLLKQKINDNQLVSIHQIDIKNKLDRDNLIKKANVVISLMPPSLHYLIARSCIELKKHLLTASYVDDAVKKLATEIENANILFLYEMGLDPGIDHMSAMQLINQIQDSGGKISSFKSHCGGIVAPESDDNLWHYKISWNPRNIVLAGKAGAVYLENRITKTQDYTELFRNCSQTEVMGMGSLAYYPNRDSLSYIAIYGLENIQTFVRTTLRHPDFCKGWQQIIDLKLTDEEPFYETSNLTITRFLEQHLERFSLKNTYQQITDLKTINQFDFLFKNDETIINKGFCSAADVLQFIVERKLKLQKTDKDMIVMQHEIEYEGTRNKGQEKKISSFKAQILSTLIVKGHNNSYTAMAKTVGLPLGIAAKLIIEEKIELKGLHIPIVQEIYNPVLQELKNWGIEFTEQFVEL